MCCIKQGQVLKVGSCNARPRLHQVVAVPHDDSPDPCILLFGALVLRSSPVDVCLIASTSLGTRCRIESFEKLQNRNLSAPLLHCCCVNLTQPQDQLPQVGVERGIPIQTRDPSL